MCWITFNAERNNRAIPLSQARRFEIIESARKFWALASVFVRLLRNAEGDETMQAADRFSCVIFCLIFFFR